MSSFNKLLLATIAGADLFTTTSEALQIQPAASDDSGCSQEEVVAPPKSTKLKSSSTDFDEFLPAAMFVYTKKTRARFADGAGCVEQYIKRPAGRDLKQRRRSERASAELGVLEQVFGKKLNAVRGFLQRILREPSDNERIHLLQDPKKKETLLLAEFLLQHLCCLPCELNKKFSDFEADSSGSSEFIKALAKHPFENYSSAIDNLSRIVEMSAQGISSEVALFPALDNLLNLCLDPNSKGPDKSESAWIRRLSGCFWRTNFGDISFAIEGLNALSNAITRDPRGRLGAKIVETSVEQPRKTLDAAAAADGSDSVTVERLSETELQDIIQRAKTVSEELARLQYEFRPVLFDVASLLEHRDYPWELPCNSDSQCEAYLQSAELEAAVKALVPQAIDLRVLADVKEDIEASQLANVVRFFCSVEEMKSLGKKLERIGEALDCSISQCSLLSPRVMAEELTSSE